MPHQDDCTDSNLPNNLFMARVMEARDGEAITLIDVPGRYEPVVVFGHSVNTPWLEADDSVLVVPTPQGAVVFDRLRCVGEPSQTGFDISSGGALFNRLRGA